MKEVYKMSVSMFPDSQIREKLTQLQEKRDKINKKWQDKMDHLQIGKGAVNLTPV